MKSIAFITPELHRLDRLGPGMLALFCFEEMKPLAGITSLVDWRLHGHLSRLIIDGFFAGSRDELLLMPLGRLLPQQYLLVMGLGKRASFSEETFDRAVTKLFETARGIRQNEITLSLPGRVEGECDSVLAIERLLKLYEDRGNGLEVRVIEPTEAQKVMIPVAERWRLKQLVPQNGSS